MKFLLGNGANPHVEDYKGLDCCDKAEHVERYAKIKEFRKKLCHNNPSIRIKMNQANMIKLNSPVKQMTVP